MIPEEVERLALLGWELYPQSTWGRAACIKDPTEHATSDLDIIAGWCRAFPGCNWRIVFGHKLWGIDLDVPPGHASDGVANFAAWAKQYDPLPPRPVMRTGGGGLAIIFRNDGAPIIGKSGVPVDGADPRRGRQSQTVPPSIHHTTKQPYRWIVAPWDVDPPVAPAWLLSAVKPPPEPEAKAPDLTKITRPYVIAALHNSIRRVAAAPQGHRNNTLNQNTRSLGKMVGEELSEAEIRDCMMAAARAAAIPIREAMLTIESALKSARK